MAKIRPPLKEDLCTGGLKGVGGGGEIKTSSKTPAGADGSNLSTGSGFKGIAEGESGATASIKGGGGATGGTGGGTGGGAGRGAGGNAGPESTGMLGGIGCGGASTDAGTPVKGFSFNRGISALSTDGAGGGKSAMAAG